MSINKNTDNNLGFIILRHVNNESTNKYWLHCYECIRKYYPENKIMIIDDNSDYKYITNEKLFNTFIINSEYSKRGEILPYYYYLYNKLFDNAVIFHDSVFINKYVDFKIDKYKIIWEFEHHWDNIDDETKMIKLFNDSELLNFYENKLLWKGCFGSMSVINHDFLCSVNQKYPLSKLLDVIKNRSDRCCFERIIGCLLQKEYKKETLLGNIHNYIQIGIGFSEKDTYSHLPIVKVFTGR